jgi:putative endonuclease
VRSRAGAGHGGALASIGASKQRHIVRAAQHYLLQQVMLPPCRFDGVCIEGGRLQWLKGAFTAA